ncbi:iron-siderophore ABC transporter substrate-binding protein [Trichocoleus sp. FACHB-262]|nr:iron-siderophore ABC transporter substrate-binding protein [Trichocoleus sp. FACHB-262]
MGKIWRSQVSAQLQRYRDRWLRLSLLLLLTLMTTVACGRDVVSDSGSQPSLNSPAATTSETRSVQHAMGTTQVPAAPQRVVSLSWLDTVLSLGVQPIGSNQVNDSYLQERTANIPNVGRSGAPSLEKILALKPDLILGWQTDHKAIYPQLSRIASTVIDDGEGSGAWKKTLQLYAQALGKTAEAEQLMAKYKARLEEFKQKMGAGTAGSQPDQTQVSVVRVYPDGISLYLKDSFCGTILADAGLSRPSSQNLSASEAKALGGNSVQLSISRELLSQADGDVLFVWTGENDAKSTQAAQKQLEQLKSDPLWANLTAVKQNRVYQVPKYWIGSGPIAANLVIDDLFKYLVDEA